MESFQNPHVSIEHDGKTVFQGTVADLDRAGRASPDEGSTNTAAEPKLGPADESVLETARELTEGCHGELVEARIAYLFRYGGWFSNDKVIPGEAYKVGDRQKAGGYPFDFEIVLNYEDAWTRATSEARCANLDHQLSHCRRAVNADGEYDSNDDGTPKWRKVPHDFGDFFEVVRRNGTRWHEDLEKLSLIIRQPELPGLDEVAEE